MCPAAARPRRCRGEQAAALQPLQVWCMTFAGRRPQTVVCPPRQRPVRTADEGARSIALQRDRRDRASPCTVSMLGLQTPPRAPHVLQGAVGARCCLLGSCQPSCSLPGRRRLQLTLHSAWVACGWCRVLVLQHTHQPTLHRRWQLPLGDSLAGRVQHRAPTACQPGGSRPPCTHLTPMDGRQVAARYACCHPPRCQLGSVAGLLSRHRRTRAPRSLRRCGGCAGRHSRHGINQTGLLSSRVGSTTPLRVVLQSGFRQRRPGEET